MKKFLTILLLFLFPFTTFAETDVQIDQRLREIRKTICKSIEDKEERKACNRLAKPFLPSQNRYYTVKKIIDGDTLLLNLNIS